MNQVFSLLKDSHARGVLTPIYARKRALERLLEALLSNEQLIFKALHNDLGRSDFESYVTECALIKGEIRLALKSLHSWMKPKAVSTPIVFQPGKSYVEVIPKGVVLIIAPWNYPLQLSLLPLVSAIAAGNCVMLKPSELAPHTGKLIEELIHKYLDSSCFRVIQGDARVAQELLDLPFDHIFYTGSGAVGREVMKKAAEHLTPVTLELGGKSPCIIDNSASLDLAVKRIWWAKCLNAGQTCIAPDYVLITKERVEDFIALSKKHLHTMFGPTIKTHPSYGRIITTRHTQRLINYLRDGHIMLGGSYDLEKRFFEPTVVIPAKNNSPIMEEEIFGPILPVLSLDSIEQAFDIITQKPIPLALYVFSEREDFIKKVQQKLRSGGLGINECVSHGGILGLPFGGMGPSGMGHYHGRFGFDTFSHMRAVYKRASMLDNPIKYAPYSEQKLKLVRLVM